MVSKASETLLGVYKCELVRFIYECTCAIVVVQVTHTYCGSRVRYQSFLYEKMLCGQIYT